MVPVKLAFIVESLASGGAEKVCVLLSNYFVEHNISVTIYIKNNSKASVYNLNENVQVKEVRFARANRNKLRILSSAMAYVINLAFMLKRDNPDIIVSFGTTLNMITILIAKWINKPIIVSEHTSHEPINHKYTFGNFIKCSVDHVSRKLLYRFADKVTVLTQHDYIYYKKFLKNVIVMHNPILRDGNEYKSDRKNTVLGVGTYESYYIKGFDRLFNSFPYDDERCKKWVLILAGKGKKEHLELLKKETGHPDFVKLPGEVKDMKSLYESTSVFVLSSRREGLPMALLEAMSYGCACVSFDIISGPSEIIDDGINGFLVKDGDLNTFRNRIIQLIENEELRRVFGKAAIEKSLKFSIDAIGENWIKMINNIVVKSN